MRKDRVKKLVGFFDQGQNAIYIVSGRDFYGHLAAHSTQLNRLLLDRFVIVGTRLSGWNERMQRRILTSSTFARLIAWAVLISSMANFEVAYAQVRIPAPAIQRTEELQAVLEKGTRLEDEQQWGAALTHYEDAVKDFPDHTKLKHRLDVSRYHFDLSRRYADSSYTSLLKKSTEQQSLNLYAEVLQKVNTYYVNTPDWKAIVGRGTMAMDIACTDPIFVKTHLGRFDAKEIDQFRQELHRTIDWRQVRNRDEAATTARAAAHLAHKHLGISPTVTILEYTCGAIGTLDPYSSYLTQAQLDDVYSQIEGNFVGLGIELKADQDSLLIVNVIGNSPAQQAGIKKGDRFIEVDGHSTRQISTDKAADMLKGVEGSTVNVMVVSPNLQPRRVTVRRQRVEVPSVEDVKMLDKQVGVGYFKISSFQKTTSRDVDAALWKLHREGMRRLIVDVRGNPGGLLRASVDVVDKFVTDGTIVSTRGRSPREDFDHQAHRVGTWRVPLVVLIDGDSASASEIFAGAIRDKRRGTIVGERSYGKGSVQGIFPLSLAKSGVRLTTAKFYSPSGQAISNRGVHPDVAVHRTAKPLDTGEIVEESQDIILKAGLQAARGQLTRQQ